MRLTTSISPQAISRAISKSEAGASPPCAWDQDSQYCGKFDNALWKFTKTEQKQKSALCCRKDGGTSPTESPYKFLDAYYLPSVLLLTSGFLTLLCFELLQLFLLFRLRFHAQFLSQSV